MRARVVLVLCATAAAGASCNAILDNQPAALGDMDAGGSAPGDGNDSPPAADLDAAATAPSHPSEACEPGKKRCDGVCVTKADPAFGCAAMACSPCKLSRASPTCDGDGCAIGACNPGYADCDQVPENGCETDLAEARHCGACNAVCGPAAPICVPSASGFACTMSCSSSTDPDTCGASCTRCPGGIHATPSCVAGKCGLVCWSGFLDCDRKAANGCEAVTTNGACGVGAPEQDR